MIEKIPVTAIRPSPLNPRKRFDEDGLTELAESIKADGLLQNLVVRQNDDGYELAAGERRWRALQQLVDAGDLPSDHTVPCAVRDLTDLQLLQLATTENMARKDMSPLEEARAFQQMLELGSDVDTISAETGLSVATVRKRLALVERLTGVAQEALEAGQINLGQAQALTATSPVFQDSILNDLGEGERLDGRASWILSQFQRKAPPVSVARFPLSKYKGTLTKPSIFAEDSEDRFDDIEQFRTLQAEAAQKLLEEAQRSWGWAELRKDAYGLYGYEQLPEDKPYDPKELGVFIIYDPTWGDGSIEIRERMRKRPSMSTSAPKAEQDLRAITQKHAEEIGRQRKHALQTAVVKQHGRSTKELLVLMLTPGMGVESHLNQSWSLTLDDASPVLLESLESLKDRAPTIYSALLVTTEGWKTHDSSQALTELRDLPDSTLDLLLAIVTARLLLVHGSSPGAGTAAIFSQLVWADDHLPSFAELGEDWLKLYRPARLKEVSATVLGYSGEGKTKKQLISLITAVQPHIVPAELKLEQEES